VRGVGDDDVLRRLDELEAESHARRDELREIAAQLPAALSRKALARAVVADLRHSPNKGEIAWRAIKKLVRTPSRAAQRALRRR
jgi:hypothetical protein